MSSRALAIYLGLVIILFVVASIFVYRPVPFTGVDGELLADSHSRQAPFGSSARCGSTPKSEGWRCSVTDSSGGTVIYLVDEIDWWGCWTSSKVGGSSSEGLLPRMSGCVNGFDL